MVIQIIRYFVSNGSGSICRELEQRYLVKINPFSKFVLSVFLGVLNIISDMFYVVYIIIVGFFLLPVMGYSVVAFYFFGDSVVTFLIKMAIASVFLPIFMAINNPKFMAKIVLRAKKFIAPYIKLLLGILFVGMLLSVAIGIIYEYGKSINYDFTQYIDPSNETIYWEGYDVQELYGFGNIYGIITMLLGKMALLYFSFFTSVAFLLIPDYFLKGLGQVLRSVLSATFFIAGLAISYILVMDPDFSSAISLVGGATALAAILEVWVFILRNRDAKFFLQGIRLF